RGVGEVEADIAHSTGMDAKDFCRAAPTSRGTRTADGEDAVAAQSGQHLRNRGAGQAQSVCDLAPRQLVAAMKEGQHRRTMLLPGAPSPFHDERRYGVSPKLVRARPAILGR